jgi:hypothetical protein
MPIFACLVFIAAAAACESKMASITVRNEYPYSISVIYFISSSYPPEFELPIGATADMGSADLKNLTSGGSGTIVEGRGSRRLESGVRVLMILDADDGRIVDYIPLTFDQLEASDWHVTTSPE